MTGPWSHPLPTFRDVGTVLLFCTWPSVTISALYFVCKLLFLVGPVAMVSILTLWLLAVSFSSRRFVSANPGQQKSVLGKPLLFTCRMSHTRLHPLTNQFTYRVLLAGLPVGARGCIGPLLDLDRDNERPVAACNSIGAYWEHIQHAISWFSFQSDRYLHTGDHHQSLEEKLHGYLREVVNQSLGRLAPLI